MPRKPRKRSVHAGVKVQAVKSTSGRPAVTVHVEIDPAKLREEVGDFGRVKEVVAEIPGPARSWRPEPMHRQRGVPRDSGEPLETYSATHYGPSESHERGVGVTIETEGAGSLAAQGAGEAHAVGDADKPVEPRTVRSPTRK